MANLAMWGRVWAQDPAPGLSGLVVSPDPSGMGRKGGDVLADTLGSVATIASADLRALRAVFEALNILSLVVSRVFRPTVEHPRVVAPVLCAPHPGARRTPPPPGSIEADVVSISA